MNVKELAAKILEANAEALGTVPEPKLRLIVRETLKAVKEAVEATDDGLVNIETLGQFKVRMAEVDRDGVKTRVRRAVFHAGKKPAPDGEAGAGGAGGGKGGGGGGKGGGKGQGGAGKKAADAA